MKKITAYFLTSLIFISLSSCSFFGKKEEKKEKPATTMAVEFVKKAKEKIKEIKKEQKEKEQDAEQEENIVLTQKDFEAYLKSLDLAVEKMKKQNIELEKKLKDGNLSAMDIISFSLNSLGSVFNPDAYLDKIAKTEEEKEHFDNAFRKIIKMYSYIGEKDVDKFKKENEENAKEAEKQLKAMQEKIKEMRKKNPELAKKMEENMGIVDLNAIESMSNPLKTFSESELSLYKKYQKDICAKNQALKEEITKLKNIFENYRNKQ